MDYLTDLVVCENNPGKHMKETSCIK